MPQRFLRPGITNSDRWNSVSFEAQSLFVRILTLVDDFGRYDGRVPILHGQCFALRPDITPQETAAFRSELHRARLVTVYVVDGKDFVQVEKWQERARGERSKYPDAVDTQDSAAECDESAAEGSEPLEKDASLATTSSPLHHRPSPSPSASAESSASPPPAGDNGIVEGKQSASLPTTPQSMRIATIFHRKLTTPWTDKERKAYRAIGTVPDEDLAALESYYAANWPPNRDVNILRHDLLTFLNNFSGEVDRAHAVKDEPTKKRVSANGYHGTETASARHSRKEAGQYGLEPGLTPIFNPGTE